MFEGTVATGSITWNPAQGLCNDEDIGATQADIGDCARSTYNTLECNVGKKVVKPSQSNSHKRAVESSIRQAQGKKEKKVTRPAKLASQIGKLYSVVESRSNATSIARVFAHMFRLRISS